MALVWMVGYWTFTQIPGAAIALVWALVSMFTTQAPAGDWDRWAKHPMEVPGMSTGLLVGLGVAQVLAALYAWILLRNLVGRDWKKQIGIDRLPQWGHLLATLALVPGMVLASNALVAMAGEQGLEGEAAIGGLQVGRQVLEDFQRLMGGWPSWAAVLVVAVGPAVGEELFCRGFLGHGLLARHGAVTGVVLTSILFGVMHLVPLQAAYAALLGLVLHGLRLATGSLWAPILAHFANNALSVLGTCEDSPIRDPLVGIEAWVQASPGLALVAGLGVLMVGLTYLSKTRVSEPQLSPSP